MAWWRKTADDDEASLRAQLLTARARVAEQLEVMTAGPASHSAGWRPRYHEQAAQLAQTLAEIDESLTLLAPAGAASSLPRPDARPGRRR
jgi:hypothetical protein